MVKNKTEQGSKTDPDPKGKRQRKRSLPPHSRVIAERFEGITGGPGKKHLFANLIKGLHTVLEFDDAFILQMQDDQRMLSIVSTSERLRGTSWEPGAVFKRVLSGRPVASSEINQVSEWVCQPEEVRRNICSALHVNLHEDAWRFLWSLTPSLVFSVRIMSDSCTDWRHWHPRPC